MTVEQIKIGIPKIVNNAEELYQDAEILLSNNRIERAYALFQLSIEEIAKAFILTNALIFDDISSKEVSSKLEKMILNHEYKSRKSIGIESYVYEILKNIDEKIYEKIVLDAIKEYSSIKQLNNKKNESLYVSFINHEFVSPNEKIEIEEVKKIKTKAGFRIQIGKGFILGIVKNNELIKEKMKEYLHEVQDTERVNEYTRIIRKHKGS